MQLDDLLVRYFGVRDLSQTTADAVAAGVERALVELGMERDRGKRFAIWSMLYLLGRAPDLDVVFKDAVDQNAARNFMDLMAAAEGDEAASWVSVHAVQAD